jgi:hypothetical protein
MGSFIGIGRVVMAQEDIASKWLEIADRDLDAAERKVG